MGFFLLSNLTVTGSALSQTCLGKTRTLFEVSKKYCTLDLSLRLHRKCWLLTKELLVQVNFAEKFTSNFLR